MDVTIQSLLIITVQGICQYNQKILKILNSQYTALNLLVAQKPVSIRWQIVFVFISPLNLWAFYRIQKLRKALLYVFIPSSIIEILIWFFMLSKYPGFNTVPSEAGRMLLENPYIIFTPMLSIGFLLFSIHLMLKWSRQWNLKFQV